MRNSHFTRSLVLPLSLLAIAALASACGSKKKSGPTTTYVDVHGTVVYPSTDVGNAGIVVLTSGQTPATTGADGTFSFTHVKTPYTLTLIDSANKTGVIWNGLTIAAPILPYGGPTTAHSIAISGTVTGLQGGAVSLHATAPHHGIGGASVSAMDGTFNGGSLNWLGPTTNTFTLWATGRGPTVSDVIAVGSATVSATEGMDQSGLGVAMAAVTPVPMTFPVSGVPASSFTATLLVTLSDANTPFAAQLDAAQITSSGTISLNVPHVGSNAICVEGDVLYPSGAEGSIDVYGLTGNTASIAFNAQPSLTLPVDAATGVGATTTFSWAAEAQPAVYAATFYPTSGGQPTFILYTTATSATLPDLSTQGLALPATAAYNWSVGSFGPDATLDDLVKNGGAPPATGTTFFDVTAPRTFTTQ